MVQKMRKGLLVSTLLLSALATLAYQRITSTSPEEESKVGPVEVTAETEKSVRLPPILGAAAVGTGLLLVLIGARRP
jgi:hypothetical protein